MIVKYIKIALLVVTASVGSFALAEGNSVAYDYQKSDVSEIEVSPYEQIKDKWQVEIEFENDKEVIMYVYEIDGMTELLSEVTETVNDKLGVDFTEGEIQEIWEVEDEDENKEQDEDKYEDNEKSDEKKEKYEDRDDGDKDDTKDGDDENDSDDQDEQDRLGRIEQLEKQLAQLIDLVIKLLTAQLQS